VTYDYYLPKTLDDLAFGCILNSRAIIFERYIVLLIKINYIFFYEWCAQ